METKIDRNVLIDLSNPLENILHSIVFDIEDIESHDCVSGLVNIDRVISVS